MLQDKLILEFEVLSPPKANTGFIEVFLESVAVVFETAYFTFVEVHVVLGGAVEVDLVVYLLFQLASVDHLTAL